MAPPVRDPAATPEAHVARWRASGDPQAFGALFDVTAGVLFRVAVTLVPDAATAEDVLQQTYAVALRKLARFEPGRPVMPWLLNVLQKEAAKARRAARRAPEPRRLAAASAASSAEAGLDATETEAVRGALESLAEPYRSAALHRWRYGLEPAEIAHVRGEPPGTVRSLLSRAVEKLRRGSVALPAAFLGEARPPRGLSAVRSAVVAHATSWTGSAAAAAAVALGGGLLVKKALVLVAILAALGAGWWALRPEGAPPSPPDAGPSAPPLAREGSDPAATAALERDPKRKPAPAADPAARPSIRGRVVDESGRPVADAFVVACARDRADLVESDSSRPDPSLAIGSTGADGRFDLARPDVERATLLVLAKGHAAGWADAPAPGVEREIVVRACGRVHGRVMDAKGRPVPGARVRWLALLGAFHTERATSTDATGAYAFDDVPSAGTKAPGGARLVVDAEGFARQILEPWSVLGLDLASIRDAEMNVVLSRGSRVEGRVVFDGGAPAAGARVVLWTMDGELCLQPNGAEHPARAFHLGEAVADGDGRFAFDHAPCRGFHDVRQEITSLVSGRKIGAWLLARAPGTTTAIGEVPLVGEGERLAVEMRLRPAFSVEGRVVDGAGKPLAGMQVWANVLREGLMVGIPEPYRAEFPTEGATSGADGAYRMDGVQVPRPGEPPFGVGAVSNRTLTGNATGDARDHVFVEVAGPHAGVLRAPDLVIAARPFPWGRVRVLREDGTPVVGASLGFVDGYLNARSDADGRARVEWFAIPDPKTTIPPQPCLVRAAGFAVQRVAIPLSRRLEDAPVEVVVRLAPGHRLLGRVTAAEGALPDQVVVIVGNGRVAASRQPQFPFPDRSGDDLERTTFTDYGTFDVAPDGSFVAEGLPEGPYHVLASWKRPPSADVLASPTYVTALAEDVPEGATDVSIVLRFPSAAATRDVEVGLVDAATGDPTLRPYANLLVEGRQLVGRRAAPGVVAFHGVPLGRHLLVVGAEGYASEEATIDLTEDSAPLQFRLSRGARVSGRIVGSDGKPFRGQVLLEPWDSGGGKHVVSADPTGGFEAQGLPPGRYRVTGLSQVVGLASPMSAAADLQLVDVGPDAPDVRVEGAWVAAGGANVFSLDPRLSGPNRAGFLTAEQEALTRAVTLEVRDPSGRAVFRRTGFTVRDPRVEFSGILPPGAYRALLTVPGEPVREKRFEVVAGRRLDVAFPAP